MILMMELPPTPPSKKKEEKTRTMQYSNVLTCCKMYSELTLYLFPLNYILNLLLLLDSSLATWPWVCSYQLISWNEHVEKQVFCNLSVIGKSCQHRHYQLLINLLFFLHLILHVLLIVCGKRRHLYNCDKTLLRSHRVKEPNRIFGFGLN